LIFDIDEKCIELVWLKFSDKELTINHLFILSGIVFNTFSCSTISELEHCMLVSSAYKIGFDILFIKYDKSLIYKRKSKGPSIEPCGTHYIQFATKAIIPDTSIIIINLKIVRFALHFWGL
jgi:hypothetical protein